MTLTFSTDDERQPEKFVCGVTDPPAHAQLCVQLSGDDVATFLQGQLTADITKLGINECLPAALCTVQGRVSVVFDVLRFDECFALIIPAALVEATVAQLKKYVMRSKVMFGEPASYQTLYAYNQATTSLLPGQCRNHENVISYVPAWAQPVSEGWLFTTEAPADTTSLTPLTWSQAHVLWGVARPNEHTTQTQLPQMLNLDALGAVSFNKGCYTGQEIIARTHFRGTVKRRLFRYVVNAGPEQNVQVNYGDKLKDKDGKPAGTVVEWAMDDDQRIGILAVMSLSAMDQPLFLDTHPLQSWPLPYALENMENSKQ